jgi:hypothetical protein
MPGKSNEVLRIQIKHLRILESDAELREQLTERYGGEWFQESLSERQVMEGLEKGRFAERGPINRGQDNSRMEFSFKELGTRYGKVVWRTSEEEYSTFDWYEFLD